MGNSARARARSTPRRSEKVRMPTSPSFRRFNDVHFNEIPRHETLFDHPRGKRANIFVSLISRSRRDNRVSLRKMVALKRKVAPGGKAEWKKSFKRDVGSAHIE